jgi:hypothetical protein
MEIVCILSVMNNFKYGSDQYSHVTSLSLQDAETYQSSPSISTQGMLESGQHMLVNQSEAETRHLTPARDLVLSFVDRGNNGLDGVSATPNLTKQRAWMRRACRSYRVAS